VTDGEVDGVMRPTGWRVRLLGTDDRRQWRDVGILALAMILARLLATFVLSSAFNTWPARIGWDMHLVDLGAVRAHPVTSLLHLHSQPPLFTVVSAVVSALPSWLATISLYLGSILLGVLTTSATYVVARAMGVRRWLSLAVVVVGVVLSPAWLLWASIAFYPYPTACLISLSLLALLRFAERGTWGWGLTFASLLAGLVLLDSLYQVPWMLAALALVVLVAKVPWRKVLLVSLVPLVLVLGWTAKNIVIFGVPSTSSWVGINLSKTAIIGLDHSDVTRLVAQGTLSPLAEYPGFRPLPSYPAGMVHIGLPTGVAVLDEQVKPDGQVNLNNLAYVGISKDLLGQDLRAIGARPGHYAANVGRAGAIWFSPSDDNVLFRRGGVDGTSTAARSYGAWLAQHQTLSPAMATYRDAYDTVVGIEPRGRLGTSWLSVTLRSGSRPRQVSLTAVVGCSLCLLGVPLLAWRRRHHRAEGVLLVYLWGTVAMVATTSTLLELGENDRFRFMLGTLVLLGATVVLDALLTGLTGWREGRRQRSPTGASH